MQFNLPQLCKPRPVATRSLAVHNIGGAEAELFLQHQKSSSARSNVPLVQGNARASITPVITSDVYSTFRNCILLLDLPTFAYFA